MTDTNQFPYLNTFEQTQKKFDLQKTTKRPQRIVWSKWTRNPEGVMSDGVPSVLESASGEASIVLDLGEELVGWIQFKVFAENGGELRVYYGEHYDEVLRDVPFKCSWYSLPVDRCNLEPGSHEVVRFGRRAFRYVRFTAPEGVRVNVKDVVIELCHYPVQDNGSFSCSDTVLNRIWDLAKYTTKLCMQQFYEDGIKRDGLLWIGDYRIQFLCNFFPFGDVDLARKSLYMIASTQRIDGALTACASIAGGHQHPENIDYMQGIPHNWVLVNYCSDFISSLKEYFIYTQDEKTLHDLWPFATRTIKYLSALDVESLEPSKEFITDNQFDVEADWWASRGALLMQLVWAMRDGDWLARKMGDSEIAVICDESAHDYAEHANQNYYSDQLSMFTDTPAADSENISFGWHTNALAVLAGQLSPDKAIAIFDYIRLSDEARYPVCGMMKFWTQEALFRLDLAAKALQEMREYYGFMLAQGSTTTWEKLDLYRGERLSQDYPTSLCHGWSAGPAYHLPAYVLGIQPSHDGWSKVILRPQLGGLDWAEGGLITPYGELFVHWENVEQITGHIRVPDGVEVVVIISQEPGAEPLVFGSGIHSVAG